MAEDSPQTPPGPGVDASGQSVIDPSYNVLALVEAANRRQDDLREAEKVHLREVLALRAEAGERERTCGEEVADLTAQHLHAIAGLRASYDKELRRSETDRINAIRTVDVEAVQRAAEVQSTQASTLAKQVSDAAEAMRVQVAQTATQATTGLAAALEPIQKDIQDLRKAQYEAQGQKTQVVETQSKGASVGVWVGLAVAGFVAALSMIGVFVAILTATP